MTTASKRAIGLPTPTPTPTPLALPDNTQRTNPNTNTLVPHEGSPADFVLLHETTTLQDAALNPCYDRTTVKAGKVVAWRRSRRWTGVTTNI